MSKPASSPILKHISHIISMEIMAADGNHVPQEALQCCFRHIWQIKGQVHQAKMAEGLLPEASKISCRGYRQET